MPVLTPAAGPLDGSESFTIDAEHHGGTITLAQLQAFISGFPLSAGVANAPVGDAAVASVAGTEAFQMFTAATGGWKLATLAQIMAWITDRTVAPFALPASGVDLGGLPQATAFDDADAFMVRQGGGSKAVTLGQLSAWMPRLTLSGPLAYSTNAPAGTTVATIGNVPAGAIPAIAPNDGRLAVAGSQAAGWSVVTGSTASTAGTIPMVVTAAGAVRASAPVVAS